MANEKEINFNRFINNLVQQKFDLDNSPVQLTFGLTNLCNLHCAFCPYCGFCMEKIENIDMLPISLIRKMGPYLARAKFLNPSGRGEPLLYDSFEEFIDICREYKALDSMQLINNGTQLHRYNPAKFDGINIISISIDSVEARTFELLRYGAKLEQVLNNISRLRKALPNTVLQWTVVVNRLNIGQLVDIYREARNYGINYITFNDIYGYEEDKVIQLLRLRDSDRKAVDHQFEEIQQMNSDHCLVVNNVISWSGFEDGVPLDTEKIFQELLEMKSISPYLNFDQISQVEEKECRVKTENRKELNSAKVRLPYCTNPFEAMFILPNQTVLPCCSPALGGIDKIENDDIEAVWNGKKYQELRESMFNWDMLPESCRKCDVFMRYDYIDAFWEQAKTEWGGGNP